MAAVEEDFANLEAWKQSQQRTIELIIGLLPPEQQEVQRQQLQLMQQLQKLPIERQKDLIETAAVVPLPTPIPGPKAVVEPQSPPPTISGSKLPSLKHSLIQAEEKKQLSSDFSSLKAELSFLENLQKLLTLKSTPQQQIEQLTQHYQQLQNLQKQPIAITAQSREPLRVASRKETKENEAFVKEQIEKFYRGEPNFVAVRDTHYRIKPPHGKHCYIVCKKCNYIATTRHFKNHYRRHEIVTVPLVPEHQSPAADATATVTTTTTGIPAGSAPDSSTTTTTTTTSGEPIPVDATGTTALATETPKTPPNKVVVEGSK